MSLRVKKFDPASMKESRVTFLIGKRGSGKSVLMKDLLYNMPRPDYVLAMAPTEDTLAVYREFLPESCIFDHFSQEKLERAVSLQKELVAQGKKRTVLIILDDCLYQKNVLKSTAMRHIFFNGRHDHIAILIAAQYMMDVEVSLRTNIDYLFTMREVILANRQRLYKNFFGQFGSFAEFEKVMVACTQDYRSLVMDNTNAAVGPMDTVLWYRAHTQIPEFRLCKPVYWALNRRAGLSADDVRRAQMRQFELERASAEVRTTSSASAGVSGARITVVQTEDENGNVVTTA